MSTSLQTTLAADAHLAEGQFLLEEQTLNNLWCTEQELGDQQFPYIHIYRCVCVTSVMHLFVPI
jgi:hypothetical protein